LAIPLRIDNIQLTGYKNYSEAAFQFNERLIGICGNNGKGKTNLLDAIYYLCFTKSYFTRLENLNIQFQKEGFRLEGVFYSNDTTANKVVCIYRPGKGKEIYHNELAYEKFSKHIGKFPAVLIAPNDSALITGGSEERRKYLDTLLSQIDNDYLNQLIVYTKLLTERNALLKSEEAKFETENLVLQSIDERLIPVAETLHRYRTAFCKKLFPRISAFYNQISGSDETIQIRYESQLSENLIRNLLKKNLHRDRLLQRTTAGIHKDDILFEFNSNPFKNIASQGQRKSLLFACRLAELEILKNEIGINPLLLLDDVFEKLDKKRIRNLLEYICNQNKSQVFITDTDSSRLKEAVSELGKSIQIIQLD